MAENWTKLAEAIGMVRTSVYKREGKFWKENRPDLDSMSGPYDNRNPPIEERNLATYLMEPEQTARILALDGLPGHAWLLERHGGEEAEWVASRQADNDDGGDWYNPAGGGTVGEAVARCAAECLA